MEGIPAVIKGTLSAWTGDRFGGGNKGFTAKDIPDLSGKIVLVTGGNTGIGRASCLELAKHNAHVFLAARTPSKAEAAISQIKEAVPNAQITFLEMDLASFESIKKAANTFNDTTSRLDVLLNNAGIMAVPEGLTKEGYEIQFGTNHMGHALLTKLLMPTLLKTAEQEGSDVRIVNVSSDGHRLAPKGGLVLNDAKTGMKSYSTWTRYGQSKLANVLFTLALAERYPDIKSVVIHPGAVNTDLSIGFQKSHPWLSGALAPVLMRMLKTPESGALTQLYAATHPDAKNGCYYTPMAKETALGQMAEDPKLVTELWDWTEKELKGQGY